MNINNRTALLDFTAVDVETTGLSPEKEQIIEIGAVKYRNGEVVDTFSSFVHNTIHIPERIISLTGITEDMLINVPGERDAVKNFIDFSEEDVLLGHCISFDYGFIKRAAIRQNFIFERYGIDTLMLSKQFHKDVKSKTLSSMCSHYNIINKQSHRAYSDAQAAAELYLCIRKEFFTENRESFNPVKLEYNIKKTEPATAKQKKYLIDLVNYHRIELDINWETLTKSEASRRIDRIILEHGLLKRGSR